jgi:hypothetical protein
LFLYIMLLHTIVKHNFYMHWKTKKLVWLASLRWSGTEPAISPRYACIYSSAGFTNDITYSVTSRFNVAYRNRSTEGSHVESGARNGNC